VFQEWPLTDTVYDALCETSLQGKILSAIRTDRFCLNLTLDILNKIRTQNDNLAATAYYSTGINTCFQTFHPGSNVPSQKAS
jgi:hypothetical protein